MSEIVQLHTTEQVILQTSSEESITLTGNAINVVATPFDPSVLDEIRTEFQTADAALREELLGTGGGSTVFNGTYDGTTLHSFSGEMSTGAGFLGVGVSQEGAQHIQITVPDMSAYTYWYVFAFVSNIPSAAAAFSGSQPPLFFTINKSGSNFEANAVALGFGNQQSYAINAGDVFDITFTTDSITVLQNGNPYFEGTATTTVAIPYTHVLSMAPAGFTTPADLTITGLMPAGAAGIIDTKLSLESAARQNADTNLTTYIDNKVSVVNTNLANVQTLAETNQLNISTKTDQADFDSLAEIVTDNGLLLAQKASQVGLDNLATEVSTKATPSDITAAIAALVGGAPASLDTLAEIAAALAGDQASINDLLTQINNRVRFDAAQGLNTAQQLQARQNINAEAVGVAAGLIAGITAASIGAATALQGSKADSALQSGDVAPVAFSGSYTSLLDKPTIPAAQVNADWNSSSGLSQILNKPVLFGLSSLLAGLGAGSNTAITAADSLINALAKLQAQVTSNATNVAANTTLLAPVPRKFGPSWYVSGRWYDLGYPYGFSITTQSVPAGAVRYFAYSPLETVTLQNIATNIAGAMTVGGTMKFGIYADNNGFPAARIYASSAIAGDTTGVKTAACAQTLTAGTVYWFGIFVSATAIFSANMVARTYGGGGAFGLGGLTHTGQSDITASGAGAGFTNAGYAPFLSFQPQ